MARSTAVAGPGTVSVVTGGARGIGLALARALARRGGQVVLADIDGPAATAAAGELTAANLMVSAHTVDVTDPAAVQRLVDDVVVEHGRLDLFVNNAGIALIGETDKLNADQWDAALSVNLHGVVHGMRAAYPVLLDQAGGVLVNVASLLGLIPAPFAAPYAASKAAVVGLSLALRAEARARGVRVTVVCPGFVRTEITPDAQSQRWRVLATPDRLAAAILRGLDADHAMIVWPPTARLVWRLYRASPALGNAIATALARRVTARIRRQRPLEQHHRNDVTRTEY